VSCPGIVLLASGLPLRKATSFSRQLSILASSFAELGTKALLAGPFAQQIQTPLQGNSGPFWRLGGNHGEMEFEELIATASAEAAILLGYPDQFPFLARKSSPSVPHFLWSQFSRLPRLASMGEATVVPLTEKTEGFVRQAGCSRIAAVIPHGVDCSIFCELPAGRRGELKKEHGLQGSFVVGTVANNSRRKRLDLVIRCFAHLYGQRAEARLLIKTDRSVSLDGVNLPALLDRERLGEEARLLTGQRSEASMAELYNLMDVYINLSEWEGFCIPVVEAMTCGVPVVTHPIQGPGEILPYRETIAPGSTVREEDGTTLVEADPRQAAEVLLELAGNPDMCRSLAAAGIGEAAARYDIRRVAESWLRLLCDTL